MKTYIYSLSDPLTGNIRYVGKTDNLSSREKTHLRVEKTHKSYWVQSLLAIGLMPKMEILDEVSNDEWKFWEQHWIQLIKSWGFNLVNGDNGGLGHQRITYEMRQKISNTLKRPNLALSKNVYSYLLTGEFHKEYISLASAAIDVNGSHSNISRSIRKNRMAYGFGWSYEKKDSHILQDYKDGVYVINDVTKEKLRISTMNIMKNVRTITDSTRLKMSISAKNRKHKTI